jgi:hypothetical protein
VNKDLTITKSAKLAQIKAIEGQLFTLIEQEKMTGIKNPEIKSLATTYSLFIA